MAEGERGSSLCWLVEEPSPLLNERMSGHMWNEQLQITIAHGIINITPLLYEHRISKLSVSVLRLRALER